MLNSHRKNDILNASRPTLFPLLFSHDLEVISISQSKCVVCQSVCKKCFTNHICGRKQLGEQEIQWGSVLDPLMSSNRKKQSNKVQSIQLLMSLKNTSQTHIIEIDKDVTYVYLSYYNTFMKQKKSLIIPPSEKNRTVDYPKKSTHYRLSQVDYLHILTKEFHYSQPKIS